MDKGCHRQGSRREGRRPAAGGRYPTGRGEFRDAKFLAPEPVKPRQEVYFYSKRRKPPDILGMPRLYGCQRAERNHRFSSAL